MTPEAMTQSFIDSIKVLHTDGCMTIVMAHDNLYTVHRYSTGVQMYALGKWFDHTSPEGWACTTIRRHLWPNG